MKAFLPTTSNPERAFTLIDLLGVLSILSILAWTLSEGLFLRLKDSLRDQEAEQLSQHVTVLRQAVLHQKLIPGEFDWPACLASEMARPVAEVLKNPSGWNRRLLLDPGFRIGIPYAPAPFHQKGVGSLVPIQARAVLISTLASDYPNLANIPFDDFWSCGREQLPSHGFSRWGGKGADLQIERVYFGDLFRKVYLNNLDPDASAILAIDSTNDVLVIPAGTCLERFYLLNTHLLLLGSKGEPQYTEFLSEDSSYVFERGHWLRGMEAGRGLSQGVLEMEYNQFASLTVPGARTQPVDVARVMHEWLSEYLRWSGAGYPTADKSTASRIPSLRRVMEATGRLQDFTAQLFEPLPTTSP